MKAAITATFTANLDRAKNLVRIYNTHLKGAGSGRRAVNSTDVLRAAVVFLHATLDDLLRSVARWKLPSAGAAALEDIPLAGLGTPGNRGKAPKFGLDELLRFRSSSVKKVIEQSVEAHLERSNYNNTKEVSGVLERIGVDVSKVNKRFAELTKLMDRRHNIVHRADANPLKGSGHHQAKSISPGEVETWAQVIEEFGTALLGEL